MKPTFAFGLDLAGLSIFTIAAMFAVIFEGPAAAANAAILCLGAMALAFAASLSHTLAGIAAGEGSTWSWLSFLLVLAFAVLALAGGFAAIGLAVLL